MTDDDIEFIRREFETIAKFKYKSLERITFEELDFNPFVLKLMNLKTADEIAEFLISQRVERAIVTAYGLRIQKIAKAISRTPKGARKPEIIKAREGRQNYIHLKAGPHTANKGISEEVNQYLKKTKTTDPNARVFLGMTYGKRERVKLVIQQYSHVDWLLGREFWEFISDDPECARKIFEIACDVSENYKPTGEALSYRQLKLPKMKEIALEIKKHWGEDEKEMWQRLFEENV